MRVSEKNTIYTGKDDRTIQIMPAQKKENGRAIFAGQLNLDLEEDKIALRRKQAQEQAMRMITDVWEGDKALDEDLEKRRERIKILKKDMKDTQTRIDEIIEQQKMLVEEQGMTANSQEWKDLQEEKKELSKNYNELLKEVKVEIATISATKLERLKKDPMVQAQKQAEGIMAAASKDILGILVEGGKEHIEEEKEERQEKAEVIEEQKEKQEEFIKAQKEKREEQERLIEQMPVEEMITLEQVKTDVQKEVQNIVNKMKLLAEDIKGAMVDEAM